VSDRKAKQLVTEIISVLRPAVLRSWSYDPALKKAARQALRSTEKAMLAIIKPLFRKRFQEVADAAHEFAPLLGSLGAQSLLDMVSRVEVRELDDVRPSLVWAAAWAFHEAGDLSSAHERFIRARELATARNQGALAARIAIDLGVLAYDRDDVEKSRDWYQKARQEAKEAKDLLVEATAIHNLAVEKLEQDPVAARKLLEKSLRMKEAAGASEDSKAANWSNLGILFAESGDHEQAYKLFKQAADAYWSSRDYPNLALALLNFANTSSELGRFDEANRLYRKGLAISNKFYDIHTQILLRQGYAASAFKHNRFSIAVREFRALHYSLVALGENHEAAKVLHDLALSTAKAGDRTGAVKTIGKALKQFEMLHDWDWYRRCLLLIASEIQKPASEARLETLRKAASLRGGRDIELKLTALRSLWHDLIERNMYRDASRELHREKSLLLRTDPSQLKERLHYAGMKLLDRGRKKEALRLLRQVATLTKRGGELEIAGVRQDLAIVLAENLKFAEALTLLERNIILAKQRKDRILLALNTGNLGEIKSRAGLHQEAVPLLKKAAKLSRDLHDTEGEVMWLNNLALALSDLGRNKEAEMILRAALKAAEKGSIHTEVARVLGSLGNLATKLGRFQEAAQHYMTSIEAAKKAGMKDFAISMRFNRAAAYSYDQKKDAALKDIRTVVQDAFGLWLYDLGNQASYSGARWAIDWLRPTSAGEFTAVNFLGSLMAEQVRFKDFAMLLWIAYLRFSQNRYQRFYRSLKRQLLYSDKSGSVWKKVEEMEKYMRTIGKTHLMKMGLSENSQHQA
jgi:tetratricopeptide (TPR) repeat protein